MMMVDRLVVQELNYKMMAVVAVVEILVLVQIGKTVVKLLMIDRLTAVVEVLILVLVLVDRLLAAEVIVVVDMLAVTVQLKY